MAYIIVAEHHSFGTAGSTRLKGGERERGREREGEREGERERERGRERERERVRELVFSHTRPHTSALNKQDYYHMINTNETLPER